MKILRINQLIDSISDITSLDVTLAAIAILAGILLGGLLNRVFKKTIQRKEASDFWQSLLILTMPFLTFVLLIVSAFIYRSIYDEPALLIAYFDKIAFAWFLIALAMLFFNKKTVIWFIFLIIVPMTVLKILNYWDPFVEYLDGFSLTLGQVTISLYQVIKTGLWILILLRLAKIITRFGESKIHGTKIKSANKVIIIKFFQIALYFMIFLVALDSLGISITTLAVFSGAIGVGLGFGLQKITSNFISGIILLLEKSLEIGDLIELSDGTTGFVRRSSARYILVETSQGKEILVPNEDFITQRVTNWTYSNHKGRVEIPFFISYDSDVELARHIAMSEALAHSRCARLPEPSCFVREFTNNSINLLLQFWVDDVTHGVNGPQSDIMIAMLKKFKESNIKIPYQQHDVHIQNK
jgi:small-conductance mechanosensitive channel